MKGITTIRKYFVVGVLNAMIGYFLFVGLYFLLENRLHYLVILTISTVIMLVLGYSINKIYVFDSRVRDVHELMRYASIYLLCIVINYITMYILVDLLRLHPIIAQIISTFTSACAGFIGHNLFTFSIIVNVSLSALSRPCPTCGYKKIFADTQKLTSGERKEDREFRATCLGIDKVDATVGYTRCTACAMLYAPNFHAPAYTRELPSSVPDNVLGYQTNTEALTERGYFNVLAKHSGHVGDYGEIGPHLGLFTNICAERGSYSRFTLWESNKNVHSAINGVLSGKNYNISEDIFDLDIVADASLSTFVMIHVLDRLRDPLDFMHKAYKKLKAGAIVLIVTHNEKSFWTKIAIKKWPAFCQQRPQLYCPATLRRFNMEVGLETKVIEGTTSYFPITNLINNFLGLAGIHRISVPKLNWLVLPVRLGHIITIAIKPI